MDIKLAGLDDEDIKKMYPSLRFSGEVSCMIKVLYRVLCKMDTKEEMTPDKKMEMVYNNVLGLVFVPQIEKITKNLELFLYPYL